MTGVNALAGSIRRATCERSARTGRTAQAYVPVSLADLQLSDVQRAELGDEGRDQRIHEAIDAGLIRGSGGIAVGGAILGQR